LALFYSAVLGYFELNPTVVEHLASDLIELSTRHNFAHLLATGAVCRGWARSASGNTAAGIAGIEEGIGDYRAMGSMVFLPFFLALKAEALYFADRTFEALEALTEAEAVVERSEGRWWCAELHRLRGVFLAALRADDAKIEASFVAAIRTAKQQKPISLEKRADATYAEYRRQKASVPGGRGFRLALC
jgi:predicted ATPase